MKICVLIPSYNCGRTIGSILRDLRSKGLDVVVVDDGSTDDTGRIAKSNGALVLSHNKNMGKGASMREGFKYILKSDYEAVLVMDGDNQHSVEDVDGFMNKARETGADIVIGNRMNDASDMPPVRLWTNRFMSALISRIIGIRVPDSQCGFRMLSRRVLEQIDLESSNYDIESEIIMKASREGFKIESAPIRTVYADEKSSINPVVDGFRFIALLFRVFFGPKSGRR